MKQPKKDTSIYLHQNPKIKIDLNIQEFKWTDKQKEIIDNSLKRETKMSIIDGIWGSGKSLIAVYACLKLLQEKKISNILYVRNAVQSGSGTLGWLPGDLKTRFHSYAAPMEQKLDELLPKNQVDYLIKEEVIEFQPVALIRGTSYNAYGIIIDEIGCMTKEDILLTLSRVGEKSRVFCIGDSWQVDVKNSGFKNIFDTFNDQESIDNGIRCYELKDEMDVMRSELLKFIMKKVRK